MQGGPPQGWTEKYEKENKEFAFQLARRVFFDQTGHAPYISRANFINNNNNIDNNNN